ncbi:MAG: GNAT family N-acetyltransferase [Candidatus Diapherotrites archaeon]
MEFEKFEKDGSSYWHWKYEDYLPYVKPTKEDIKNAPRPFILRDIPADWPIGFVNTSPDGLTNIIKLEDSFEKLPIDPDLRKDLRRIDRKNAETRIVNNEKNILEKSSAWFLEQWKEIPEEFEQRLELWKKTAYTISAYQGETLLAVHIAMIEEKTVYYLGCWWNREYKNLSVPIFLLKKDIEQAIKNKLEYYDLGVGDEPYKKQWGVIEKPVKYYAEIPKQLAEKLELKEFVEIKE